MNKATVRRERVTIPTYGIGQPEKNPMFLEKRVYQGSSGKVYPYPTIEKLTDEKKDVIYNAVILENEYLYIMILPELGGRVQRALDKTNGYDFVYYNRVIKPALVGLCGPWISGGIEFNWPQHHRPTTYSPTDVVIEEGTDGSASVLIGDHDRMYGTKSVTRFTLYPGKAYLEITGQLYNGTSMPQTFLWWANPAVAVNDHTQSIFPPDVHAVMDHGKRDVSRFPIATGTYYKKDYSEGVDISRYRNIPVPTSYMAEKSKYDFVGGYDYGVGAGILHVADHHVSPGKKQWTWGNGDFGKAWDRNLTDDDGPYIELMTGVFTDNQPDFTWLKPFEEKKFTQYFMPYKAIGEVKNATTEAAVGLKEENGRLKLTVYGTSEKSVRISLAEKEHEIFAADAVISPTEIFSASVDGKLSEDLKLSVTEGGRTLVSYVPEKEEIPELPEPAKAAKDPSEIMTNEELYLTALHIEQYRHATFLPDPYYLEGLKRDALDTRINTAYGMLLFRRGNFANAEHHFRTALKRLTERNPNPYTGEAFYGLGLALLYQGRTDEAYDSFYKATWSAEEQERAFYFLAAIDAARGEYARASALSERALIKNSRNVNARALAVYLARKLGDTEKAIALAEENLRIDPFDFVSSLELSILKGEDVSLGRGYAESYITAALTYAEWGGFAEAVRTLELCPVEDPMVLYHIAYYTHKMGADAASLIARAECACPDYCFPNKLTDIAVLSFAAENGGAYAKYYLGNLYYDKLSYERAISLWEEADAALGTFPTVKRNLAQGYYNKRGDKISAKAYLEAAFALDTSDARVFLELDMLYRKLGMSFEERLTVFESNKSILSDRDDLYIEYITLLNMAGRHVEALCRIMTHKFHPWEGGEGKVTSQYIASHIALARAAREDDNLALAEKHLRDALVYPENLGEGKLEGCLDNDIYYELGITLRLMGRDTEAEEALTLATRGDSEPCGVMYYNDQPAHHIFYKGLAFAALGEEKEAAKCFSKLLDYGERHLRDTVKIDYFAVSLPDFVIFDEDYTEKNRGHCNYLMGLAKLGMGDLDAARKFLMKASDIEKCHIMSRVMLDRYSL